MCGTAPIDKSLLPAQLQRRSEVFSNNVDSRLLSETIEIRALDKPQLDAKAFGGRVGVLCRIAYQVASRASDRIPLMGDRAHVCWGSAEGKRNFRPAMSHAPPSTGEPDRRMPSCIWLR
jgi:hypothetical protein